MRARLDSRLSTPAVVWLEVVGAAGRGGEVLSTWAKDVGEVAGAGAGGHDALLVVVELGPEQLAGCVRLRASLISASSSA